MATSPTDKDPGLPRVFMDDIRRTDVRRDYTQALRDLYYFYLDDEHRGRLAGMGRIRRAFSLLGWLLKSLLMKLSPARRLLLSISLVLALIGPRAILTNAPNVRIDFRLWSCALLLVILALELRDKLLAKDEIDVARQVQIALLPHAHPAIPGWEVWSCSRPANDVGGDLVDYVELGGFRHGVLLGDVAGKGLGAALLTAKLQATIRALVADAASLDDLGSRVNLIFHADGLDNRYATLFFAELEHDSGQMRYLNAGHNPPFLIRPDEIEKLPASSFPLGMLSTASYEEGAVELRSGDLLLVYSDGLTEAANTQGEEFGVERITALVPQLKGLTPDAVGRRLLIEVDRFLGDARLTDDLSLVVVVKT